MGKMADTNIILVVKPYEI